jgi:putative hydrolase of the HAD superfamily
MDKVIFWDFQGTLAYNDWMISKALYKALLKNEPHTKITIEEFKDIRISGIPWQDSSKDYSHLTTSRGWWKLVEKLFEEAYRKLYIDENKISELATQAHIELAKPDEFKLYKDTLEILNYFYLNGCKNIIVSNHIPELPYIVEQLGLKQYVSECISSANVGFEKPNIKIYEYALQQAKYPENAWMVGDNLVADVKGAEKAGIKGVLVRTEKNEGIKYYSEDLLGLKNIIK